MKTQILLAMMTFFGHFAFAESEYPVTDELQGQQYQIQFVVKVCGIKSLKKATKKQIQECDQKYLETFLAKIQLQYPKAKDDAGVWCKANPLDCPNDWQKIEEHFEELQAHAEYLENLNQSERQAIIDRDNRRIEEQRSEFRQQQEQSQENADRSARMQMAAAFLNRPIYQAPVYQAPIYRPVSCTTNRIGNTAFTNCN